MILISFIRLNIRLIVNCNTTFIVNVRENSRLFSERFILLHNKYEYVDCSLRGNSTKI